MKQIKEVLTKTVAVVGSIALFLVFTAGSTGTMKDMPANAIVLLDDDARTYTSPPCVSAEGSLRPARAADAYAMNYQPDKKCIEQDGFFQRGRTLLGKLMERVGILSPSPQRWNKDGTWNW